MRILRLLHAANVYVCCILKVSLPVCRYHRMGGGKGGGKGKNMLKKAKRKWDFSVNVNANFPVLLIDFSTWGLIGVVAKYKVQDHPRDQGR